MTDQNNDPELCQIAGKMFTSEKVSDIGTCYYQNDGILMEDGK